MAPGPVFTTWVSLTGSSIFNGKNNPPRQLDFRSNLLDIANLLQLANIPLIIVYTELNMNPGEKETLRSDFKHNNILVINTQELNTLGEISYLLKKNRRNFDISEKHSDVRHAILLHLLDALRFNIFRDKNMFIAQAIRIAREQNKQNIAYSLEQTQQGSLIYTDADNILLKPPMYQLAPPYLLRTTTLAREALNYFKTTFTPSKISPILDIDTGTLLEHESHSEHPITVTIDTSELKKQTNHIAHELSSNTLDMKLVLDNQDEHYFFQSDIGYLRTDNVARYTPLLSYQEKKLAIIQQYAWLYIARTESWR